MQQKTATKQPAPACSIALVDYQNPEQTTALLQLLDEYAASPSGGGQALAAEVKQRLIPLLANTSNAFSLLAHYQGQPVAFANCFLTVSTFKAKALVNIHDLAVTAALQGQGVGQQMLQAIEQQALARDCCKITLEVLANNHAARRAYLQFGFADYQLSDEFGNALFMEKALL